MVFTQHHGLSPTELDALVREDVSSYGMCTSNENQSKQESDKEPGAGGALGG